MDKRQYRAVTQLRMERVRRDLSQGQLGQALGGYSQWAVSRWENRNRTPTLDAQRSLERLLGLPWSELRKDAT
jgi:transcriptional regulator with XRE-family HTH domain